MSLNTSHKATNDTFQPSQPLGRIVSVSGAQAIAMLTNGPPGAMASPERPEMGALVKIDAAQNIVLGLVSALSIPAPGTVQGEPEIRILELELVGELPRLEDNRLGPFRRGLSGYPSLGDEVTLATHNELAMAYAQDEETSIEIGTLQQDETIPVHLLADDMLGKHFAILGSTGTGKSCAVALLFHRLIAKTPDAHIVLLDPHGEYASSFKDRAEVITPENLNLPFWLLTFEETCEIFVGQYTDREIGIEILSELIPLAKAQYGSGEKSGRMSFVKRQILDMSEYSTDTPVPYRLSDLIALLEENIGRLDQKGSLAPYKYLKRRIVQYSRDSRYTFMFGNLTVNDTMTDILGQIFRVPVDNKPITIIELGGLPSEVINVAVSLLARMAFDFCLWSEGEVPITLVCEEAHRYVPPDTTMGFEPTKAALSRIAKEGRKYGVSLGIISQRPSEVMPTILSQCSTVIAMRMPSERDQEILRAAISDAAANMLEFLPSMSNREAIAFGEAVALPVRFKFDLLSKQNLPNSLSWKSTENWAREVDDHGLLEAVVKRWRMRTRSDLSELNDPHANAPGDNGHDNHGAPAASNPAQGQSEPQMPDSEPLSAPHLDSPQKPGTADHAAPANEVQPHSAPIPPAQPSPTQRKTELGPPGAVQEFGTRVHAKPAVK